jgi:hypothetical protein
LIQATAPQDLIPYDSSRKLKVFHISKTVQLLKIRIWILESWHFNKSLIPAGFDWLIGVFYIQSSLETGSIYGK